MKNSNRFSYYLLIALMAILSGCQKESGEQPMAEVETENSAETVLVPDEKDMSISSASRGYINCNTYYGPRVCMGKGFARSWINIRKSDKMPLAIGIEISGKALYKLPSDAHNFAANTFALSLHPKAKQLTPFDHIILNWEPEGHEPNGIYNIPHFDMHFYKISLAEQLAITGIPTAAPPAGYLPASYVIEGATVPQMGTHWLDPSSPELPPTFALFTHTFIYGSTSGKVNFLEPMITRDFLLAGTYVKKAFPQPTLFSPTGTNYPTIYRIWKNSGNGSHYIALTNFIMR